MKSYCFQSYYLLLSILLLSTSCSDNLLYDEEEYFLASVSYKVSVSNRDVSFSSHGGTQTMTITSDKEFVVSQEGDWFTINKEGNLLTISAPYTSSSKSGAIYITFHDGAKESAPIKCVSVCQAGSKANHDYVDLGLPSGTLWATMNVGAYSPTSYGYYYSWGETKTKTYYDDSHYSYSGYASPLPLENDVAHKSWGGNWRIPTSAEIKELLDNCTIAKTTINEVKGYKVMSKRNGAYIFLPGAGYITSYSNYQKPTNEGEGYYWSSSLSVRYSNCAYDLQLPISEWGGGKGENERYEGLTIRPVYLP